MIQISNQFAFKGTAVACTPFGCGHINETFLVTTDSGLVYILQKLSPVAFKKPKELMENISAVTKFIASRSSNPNSSLHLIPTVDDKPYFRDENGAIWRAFNFIAPSVCLQKAESSQDFYNAGLAFGRFQQQLAEFPVHTLHESIPDFHNTPVRFQQFHDAIFKNFDNRAETCRKEIETYLAYEKESGAIVNLLADGTLPTRVTHNDTKLNNVLLDYDTREPLCVIDLDTVMPGSSLYDFGDSIRFGASTAAEDEKELDKVWCDMDLFRIYTRGYLTGCAGQLTNTEIEMLPIGAKIMTLECGVRFLSDYLNGDTYFHTAYPEHNLIRARTQLKLVQDMENKWAEMNNIVAQEASKLH